MTDIENLISRLFPAPQFLDIGVPFVGCHVQSKLFVEGHAHALVAPEIGGLR